MVDFVESTPRRQERGPVVLESSGGARDPTHASAGRPAEAAGRVRHRQGFEPTAEALLP